MTYPPQQPGPYGQDPYGQQPNYGQSPWGQQPDPYGQSPWGDQQGFPMGPPPPKKKGGLMAALIIVAILVIGGGGAGLYFLLKNDETDPGGGGSSKEDGPRAAADAFTEEMQKLVNSALQDIDLSPLKPYVCGDDYTRLDEELTEAKEELEDIPSATDGPPTEQIKVSVQDFKETDDGATFNFHRETEGGDGDEQELKVVEEGESWVVCGLYAEDGQEQTAPPSTGGGGGTVVRSRTRSPRRSQHARTAFRPT